jgi:prepilin-type N-terminal cleavage/methylation domain-containing protein/prepilin-type processing-associated H-X9-DG protein
MKSSQPRHLLRPAASVAFRGFTLVELLVVIAIIGVMVAMLLPAINGMRESARRSTCQNNVLRLMMALEQYQSAHESLPAGVTNPGGPIRSEAVGMHHGWLEQLLPFIDEGNVFRNIDFDVSVYDEKNAPVRKLRIVGFICPSEVDVDRPVSSYAGCHHDVEAAIDADNHGLLFLNSHVSNRDIPDGAAHTLLVGEKIIPQEDLGWMSGTRATLRNTGHRIAGGRPVLRVPEGEAPPEDPTADPLYVGGFGSYHPGGAVVGFADGSVEFLDDEIDQTVFEQLGNRADGALLDDTMLH